MSYRVFAICHETSIGIVVCASRAKRALGCSCSLLSSSSPMNSFHSLLSTTLGKGWGRRDVCRDIHRGGMRARESGACNGCTHKGTNK
uniref:Uncharacterized protein n=1 Tax=Strigamia maritima TaxID=126957 RepID=T1JD03_STRMM